MPCNVCGGPLYAPPPSQETPEEAARRERVQRAFERYLHALNGRARHVTMTATAGDMEIRDDRGREWILIPRDDLETFLGLLRSTEREDVNITVDVAVLLDGFSGR